MRVTKASQRHVAAIHLPMTEGAVSMAPFGRTFGSQGWEPRAGSALEGPPICRRTHWRHQRTHVRVLRSRGPPQFLCAMFCRSLRASSVTGLTASTYSAQGLCATQISAPLLTTRSYGADHVGRDSALPASRAAADPPRLDVVRPLERVIRASSQPRLV